MHRLANLLRACLIPAALVFATVAAAQDAKQDPASTPENPTAQLVAGMFAESCRTELLPTIPDSIRDDAGKDASPALIEAMTDVAREGMCECFVAEMRRQPDDRVGPKLMDEMEPQFKACMAAALKPRMARVCTEAQRMPKDESAPDCECLATRVAALDDAAVGAGANDLFDILNSTREIPATAGALGDAARACAAKPAR
jgi:hypothetical protein